MTTNEHNNKFLNLLYIKSKDDFDNGFKGQTISLLLNIDRTESLEIVNYLTERNLIETKSNFEDNIILTKSGIEFVEEQRKSRNLVRIKFKNVEYFWNRPKDRLEITFFYDLIDNKGNKDVKSKKVFITGNLLGGRWGFPGESSQPVKDWVKTMKYLLQICKDHLIEMIIKGTLNENEGKEIEVSQRTHLWKTPYNIDDLVELVDAEYEIEIENTTTDTMETNTSR